MEIGKFDGKLRLFIDGQEMIIPKGMVLFLYEFIKRNWPEVSQQQDAEDGRNRRPLDCIGIDPDKQSTGKCDSRR